MIKMTKPKNECGVAEFAITDESDIENLPTNTVKKIVNGERITVQVHSIAIDDDFNMFMLKTTGSWEPI